MNSPVQPVWQRLADLELIKLTEQPDQPSPSPWYVKALLAFSGWLAAWFGFAFLAIAGMQLVESPTACLVVGVVLILIGVFVSRTDGNEFVDNFSLIVSLVGQGLLAWGISSVGEHENFQYLFSAMTALYLLLIIVSGSYLHRTLFSIFLVATCALWFNQNRWPMMNANLLILPTAVLWSNEFRWPRWASWVRSIAYGLTIGVIAVNTLIGWSYSIRNFSLDADFHNLSPAWFQSDFYKIVTAIALIYLVVHCLRNTLRLGLNLTTAFSITGAIALVWAAIPAPGITTGVIVLLCGFAASNRVLVGLGIIALLTFVSSYYYQMDTTLLTKAISLAIVGAGLLVARALMTLVPRQ